MNSCYTVSIEGNIGSGKSTLLANLTKKWAGKNIVFLKEPVEEWEKITDENGETMLKKFYNNQEKYSFSFQMMAYISRLSLLKECVEKNPGCIIITERSLYTDKLVFAKMLYDTNKIEHINYQIYLKWFDNFIHEFPIKKIIYVKTSPEVCHHRINTRSRNGEENIKLDYLTNCNIYHENMLDNIDVDKLVIDGNTNIHDNEDTLTEWINKIDEFINK